MVTKNAYKTVTFAKRILSYVCCSIDGLQRVSLPIKISPIASKVYVQTLFFYTLWIEPVNLVLRHTVPINIFLSCIFRPDIGGISC